ncbi:MAG: hypothetical protein AAGH78_13375 [Cyanobacteria bacterium P01_H01_bin.58]
MSDQDSPTEPIVDPPTARRKMIWRWQWLVAPLMGVSFAMHFALLFVPIPKSQLLPEEAREEELPEEEEILEILNLSEIPIPEAPAEPQEPEPEAPQPANDAPPTLDQVEELSDEDIFQEEDDFQEDDLQDDQSERFQAKQKANQATRRLASDNFSAASTAEIARDIELDWQKTGLNRDCFLSVVDSSQGVVEPATGGLAVHYVKRNVDLIPETLCGAAGYCSTSDNYASAGNYCGAPVYELITDGEAPLFASIVETLKGAGLAIIWENLPQ